MHVYPVCDKSLEALGGHAGRELAMEYDAAVLPVRESAYNCTVGRS